MAQVKTIELIDFETNYQNSSYRQFLLKNLILIKNNLKFRNEIEFLKSFQINAFIDANKKLKIMNKL